MSKLTSLVNRAGRKIIKTWTGRTYLGHPDPEASRTYLGRPDPEVSRTYLGHPDPGVSRNASSFQQDVGAQEEKEA
jgi:hypothetical protein